ncbi:MAG: AgmX/PglI C-terminal domain-containing protein [Deltaproteobacteria bacterium]|nr:AgmX/PglI C-terminal domain-containing protein [Deltaproteobacteria bacterium]
MKKLIPLMGFLVLSCGASKEAATPMTMSESAQPEAADASASQNMQVKGLWGKIDDSIVEDTMQQHFQAFLDCYQYEALDILEEIEGDLSVYFIVGPDGVVTDEIYFEGGSLGSENTQACVIGKMRHIRFQEPIGGDSAKVRYTFPFEAPYNHPAPFDWSSNEEFLQAMETHRTEIDSCLNGKSGVEFIVYIGRGGRVESAGATAGSQDAYEAGRCLSRAARGWTFPNPGKTRPAKATVQF